MTRPRYRLPPVALLLAAAALAFPAAGAGAQANGSITGIIRNGTAGASLPSELVVSASVLNDQGNEVIRKQTTAGSDGNFRVEGFDFSAGRRVFVGTDYRGVTYSTFVEIPDGADTATGDLTIFEPTDDDSAVSIVSDVLTVVPGKRNTLEVIQLLKIDNANDRTYVGAAEGDRRIVLHFPVPQGARDVLPLEGIRSEGMTEEAEGFTTADPLLPGESSVSYVYRVNVARSGWPLTRSVAYNTERIDLLVEKTLPITTSRFKFEEQVTLQGKTYRRYRGGPFRAGEQVEANIGAANASGGLWWGLIGGLGGLSILVMAGALYRRRSRPAAEPPPAPERERLVEEIAELDEAFAAGSVEENEYRRRRDELKSRLQSITDRLTSAGR